MINNDIYLGVKIESIQIDNKTCYVRPINGGKLAVEILNLAMKCEKEPTVFPDLAAKVLCLCYCDEQGNRYFKDDQIDEIKENASLNFLKDYALEAMDLSGLDEADDIKKNAENL